MADFKNIFEKFTFIWKITNLRYCTLQTGDYLKTSSFCVPQLGNTMWYLKLYPQGEKSISEDFISCFLHREFDSGPEEIEINYIMSCSRSTIYSSKHTFQKEEEWGYDMFLSRGQKDCDHEKNLTITCEFQFCDLFHCHNIERCIFSSLKRYFPPSKLLVDLKTSEEEPQATRNNDYTFPVKYFAQTNVTYNTNNVLMPLDFSNSDTLRKAIPLTSPAGYPDLIINLIVKRNLKDSKNVVVDTDIDMTDKELDEILMVVCKITFLNKTKECCVCEQKHLFTSENKHEIWHLMESFLNVPLEQHDELTLKLDFAFSFGEIHSDMVNIEYVNIPCNFVSKSEYSISNYIQRLYNEKQLCDAVLKVNNKTFDVHKVVLGAASPVFAAMFTNKMTEHKTNIVNIVDLDEETVEEMVSFLYTSSLKELDYDFNRKLYIAAHKYQLSPLLNLCRNVMLKYIDVENICDILVIADIYNDVELEKAAVKFFKFNKNTILNLTEWEEFEEKNAKFAAKILRKICLLLE